jgi:putative DNA primase/helicase
MTDTISNDLTASKSTDNQSTSTSPYQVAEAINHNPAKWLNPDEQELIAHSLEDVEAEEMKEAFERQKLPDGTDFSTLQGMLPNVSSQYMEAMTAYLTNPDDWDVVRPDEQAPWDALKQMYVEGDVSKPEARQEVVDHLTTDLHLVPLRNTDDLLRYNPESGIYENDGERVVRERLEQELEAFNTPSEANQIIYKLKNQPSRSPDAFSPEAKVCLKNRVLDVADASSPTLEDHAPEHYFRERLPVEYDIDATCPRFRGFIQNMVAEEDISKLQEFVGYTVFHQSEMRYQKALMIVGPTAAGKSTFLDVLTALLGEDNVSHLSLQQLTNGEYALPQAYGKFANICNDLDDEIVRNVGLFKQLTAGDRVEANRKYEDYLTFRMTQKQIYAANRVPEIEYDDDAFYRRWLHVRFPNTIPKDDRDGQLMEKLNGELPGILNWALEGYARLREQDGFTKELQIEDKRDLWKAHGHSVDRFMQTQAERVSGSEHPKDKVYNAYESFCAENNIPVKAKQTFTKYLKREYNITTSRITLNGERVRCYQGVFLPDEVDMSEELKNDESSWMSNTITAGTE